MTRRDDDVTGGPTGGQDNSRPNDTTAGATSGGTIGRATAGKKSKRDSILRMLKELSSEEYAVKGQRFEFAYADILRILFLVRKKFEQEKSLVRCSLPVVIAGDIHGQYTDLMRVFTQFAEKGVPGWLTRRYVFLGDYIDRGTQSTEVMIFVFLLKIRFPKNITLLRGNHECRSINKSYGFHTELEDRFGQTDGGLLFKYFNEVFSYMPISAVVGGRILCMHGGISPELTSLDAIEKIPKPLVDPNSVQLACDMLWADPMIGLKGFIPNKVRGVSVHFGEDALKETMGKLGVKLVVRGHQMMMNGFNFFGQNKLVTVFTASSYYPDRPMLNRGSVLEIGHDGKLSFKILVSRDGGAGQFDREHDEVIQCEEGYEKCNGVGVEKRTDEETRRRTNE